MSIVPKAEKPFVDVPVSSGERARAKTKDRQSSVTNDVPPKRMAKKFLLRVIRW